MEQISETKANRWESLKTLLKSILDRAESLEKKMECFEGKIKDYMIQLAHYEVIIPDLTAKVGDLIKKDYNSQKEGRKFSNSIIIILVGIVVGGIGFVLGLFLSGHLTK